MLTVDEAEMGFAVGVGVGKGKLQPLGAHVHDRVERIVADLAAQEVREPAFALDERTVELEFQPGVEVGVVPDALFDVFRDKAERAEQLWVGAKLDQGAVLGVCRGAASAFALLAAREDRLGKLPVAHADRAKAFGERVDRFGPHAVESDRELKHLVVVLGAGVDLADRIDQLAQRDTAPVVTHLYRAVGVDLDLDPLTVPHDVLVDAVVDHLLEEHVDAVVEVGTVAQPPDVHAAA